MRNKLWLIINSIASLLVAVIAIFALLFSLQSNKIATQSNDIATQANDIAQQNYLIVYQANLPVITAITTFDYDADNAAYPASETITVRNGGGPLQEFSASLYTVISIDSTGKKTTYIQLYDLFYPLLWNGNASGLLATTTSTPYQSQPLEDAFYQAEFEEEGLTFGKDVFGEDFAWISSLRILRVSYKDYSGATWDRYFSIGLNGYLEMDAVAAWAILTPAMENNAYLFSQGLYPYVLSLDGATLLDLYKQGIFK